MLAAAHPASQLMQLRQPEAFGIFDDHHRSIGNINSHFDDHGCGEKIHRTFGKSLHDPLLFFLAHTAVNQSHISAGKHTLQLMIQRHCRRCVHSLRVLDQRSHHIDLPPFFYLSAGEFVYFFSLAGSYRFRLHGFSARRKLVDCGNIQITEKNHRQRSGNRRGRHHQNIGISAFCR